MKGKLIGQGNTAEVFAWGDKEILKLFRKEFPWEGIEKEYHISKVINDKGLPAPKVMQIIELEGRRGITYERLNGISMLDLISKKPFSAIKFAKNLANIHYQIHQCSDLELPGYKEALEWNIRHTDYLSEKQKQEVLNRLEELPEGNALCHGDFHPGNIMAEADKFYVLDWMTATAGSPAADVARTILLLKDAALPEHIPGIVKLLIGFLRKNLAKTYSRQYYKLSGMKKEEVASWRIVIAAARLIEWVPPTEKKVLLKEIEKAIN